MDIAERRREQNRVAQRKRRARLRRFSTDAPHSPGEPDPDSDPIFLDETAILKASRSGSASMETAQEPQLIDIFRNLEDSPVWDLLDNARPKACGDTARSRQPSSDWSFAQSETSTDDASFLPDPPAALIDADTWNEIESALWSIEQGPSGSSSLDSSARKLSDHVVESSRNESIHELAIGMDRKVDTLRQDTMTAGPGHLPELVSNKIDILLKELAMVYASAVCLQFMRVDPTILEDLAAIRDKLLQIHP